MGGKTKKNTETQPCRLTEFASEPDIQSLMIHETETENEKEKREITKEIELKKLLEQLEDEAI